MRKLGVDYGDARIGLALSDPLGIIASGLETYKTHGFNYDLDYITKIIKEQGVDTVVMGMPLNMDGSAGERAEKTKEFGDKLALRSGVKVEYLDERLTTVQSERLLIEAGARRDKRKDVIDMVAATIILQAYLDKN